MKAYPNFGGNSGVHGFEIGPRSIVVRFEEGGTYLYDHSRPGPLHVAQMISLARAGAGLATYINQQVRGNYAKKLDDGAFSSAFPAARPAPPAAFGRDRPCGTAW